MLCHTKIYGQNKTPVRLSQHWDWTSRFIHICATLVFLELFREHQFYAHDAMFSFHVGGIKFRHSAQQCV